MIDKPLKPGWVRVTIERPVGEGFSRYRQFEVNAGAILSDPGRDLVAAETIRCLEDMARDIPATSHAPGHA